MMLNKWDLWLVLGVMATMTATLQSCDYNLGAQCQAHDYKITTSCCHMLMISDVFCWFPTSQVNVEAVRSHKLLLLLLLFHLPYSVLSAQSSPAIHGNYLPTALICKSTYLRLLLLPEWPAQFWSYNGNWDCHHSMILYDLCFTTISLSDRFSGSSCSHNQNTTWI